MFKLIIALVVFAILSLSVFADKDELCPFNPRTIKCGPLECVNGKFSRICKDITGCWNNGEEFKRVGTCQVDARQSQQIEDGAEKTNELKKRLFVSYDDFLPTIEEEDENIISVEQIKSGGVNEVDINNDGVQPIVQSIGNNNIEIEGVSKNTDKKSLIIYSAIGLLFALLLIYFVYKKKTNKFGKFEKEIR